MKMTHTAAVPSDEITTDPQVALALAAPVLEAWGPLEAQPVLVKMRENIVLDIRIRDRGRAALRLHRPGYQDRASIEAELDWTAALHDAGVPVPPALRTLAGDWTATASDGRFASAVGWLDARPFGTGETPLGPEAPALMQALGRLIAQFHNACDNGSAPRDGSRQTWLEDDLLGAAPRWGRFFDHPLLTAETRAQILAARQAALADLARFRAEGADVGAIHADLLRENVLCRPEGPALIDFDDAGIGFRMYDLGTALIQSAEDADFAAQCTALVAGYRAARPLPDAAARRLPLFLALRSFASVGWVLTRLPPDHPAQAHYTARALKLARRAGLIPAPEGA